MSSTEPINSVVRSNAERKQIQKERLALLRKNKAFVVGTTILFIWIVLAIFGNLIAPYAADEMSFEFTGTAPSSQFWFGTDSLGQDVFSRVLIGARSILVMSFSATILGTMIGSSIGLASGYFKGALDTVIMRLLEAISAIPVLIIALLAIAAVGGRSPVVTVLVIGFVFAPNVARTVRATVLGETELEYVAAARLRAERTYYRRSLLSSLFAWVMQFLPLQLCRSLVRVLKLVHQTGECRYLKTGHPFSAILGGQLFSLLSRSHPWQFVSTSSPMDFWKFLKYERHTNS
jgi:ABC-type dipeptide/oligopeptide/nickel transport system permease subunit